MSSVQTPAAAPTSGAPSDAIEELYPAADGGVRAVAAPVVSVTLLEDRAQVVRRARVALPAAGLHRLRVHDVAPVLRDVSLRAEVEPASAAARASDVRVRRAMRVRRAEVPAVARALDERIAQLAQRRADADEERAEAEARAARVMEMVELGAGEIPTDAGWGRVDPPAWHEAFGTLFRQARELRAAAVAHAATAQDLDEQIAALAAQRRALERPDTRFVAWLEVDVVAEAPGEVDLAIAYVVPNALWRPMHAARLATGEDGGPGTLRFQSSAVVWQNTGEDWTEVELVFSTARSSLGTEPPLLRDDLLRAQRKSEQVVVRARQVAVQRAAVEGGARDAGGGGAADQAPAAPVPDAVDLPGVDDGGEPRTLRAAGRATVPSHGQPVTVPLFAFDASAEAELVSVPELAPRAFLRSVQRNEGAHPVLAGPVELLRDNGVVGWTQVRFVAPRERFELSFGPDDAVRVVRAVSQSSKVHEVDKTTTRTVHVTLYLSNLAGTARRVALTERVPVSEIEHVTVKVLARDGATPTPDANGFITEKVALPPNGQHTVRLSYAVTFAPGVQIA